MEDDKFIEKVIDDFRGINNSFNHIGRLGDIFSIWFTSNVLSNDMDDDKAKSYFIGGSNDAKLDIGIADDDHELITLCQCKFPEGHKDITKIDKVEIGKYSINEVEEILNAQKRLTSNAIKGNERWKDFSNQYRERVNPDLSNVKLIIAGFGEFTPDAMKYAIEQNIDVYDFKRIKYEYIRKTSPEGNFDIPETLELVCKSGNTSFEGSNFKTFSYFVNVLDIGKALEKYQDGLFIDNLRYKLSNSAQSKIAADIERTITKRPEELTILNNGLTIVCDKVIPLGDKTSEDGKKKESQIKLIKPKIVNGCQTSWAIFNAYTKAIEAKRPLDAYVYARIIETADQNYIKDVTAATNNQNPITARDKRAGDVEQVELFTAFSTFKPRIIYDYKAGLIDGLKRSKTDILQHFYIRALGSGKPKLRMIDNVLAGQLYLALLGEPIFAKTNKKEIFEEQEIYKILFYYKLPSDQRFNNQMLGIKAQNIKLRTGKIEYFLEDIFFAYAVYRFAEAYAGLYDKKIDLYEEKDKNEQAFIELMDDFSFVKRWNFIVVGAVNHILSRLSNNDTDNKNLRELLIKSSMDSDIFWRNTSKLEAQFNFEDNKKTVNIVKEDAPSANYIIFGKWITSIGLLIYNLVLEAKKKEGDSFNMRKFIELNPNTYRDLTNEIGRILTMPSIEKDKYFPIK